LPADVTVCHLVADVVVAGEDDAAGDPPHSEDSQVFEVPEDSQVSQVSEVSVSGSLGAQLLLWEVATAAAGRILGINPFDQPDVESAKKATRGLLEATDGTPDPAAFTDGSIEVRALGGDWLGSATTVAGALDSLLSQLDPQQGYLAIMAYLDRVADITLSRARRAMANRTGRPTTFGWGPRFLHSTGQYHKGGPATGVYLQITASARRDLAIPGREFTFGDFIAAQAGGDAQVLADHGRPVLRLHLTDHDTGLAQLTSLLGGAVAPPDEASPDEGSPGPGQP